MDPGDLTDSPEALVDSDLVRAYIDRAIRKRENFQVMVREAALDKASETLWGFFCDYINALAIVRVGRPYSDHKDLIRYAQELAGALADRRLFDAIEEAQELHANFYHGFISSPGRLRKPFEDISYFASVVDRLIRRHDYRKVIPKPRPAKKAIPQPRASRSKG